MENFNQTSENESRNSNITLSKKALVTMISLIAASAVLLLGVLAVVIYFGVTQNRLIKGVENAITPPSISDNLDEGENSSDEAGNMGEDESNSSDEANKEEEDGNSTTSYFESYRNDRQSTREQEILYYNAIIESPSSSEEAVKAAEEAKLAIISTMEGELAVEKKIIACGYADCVVSITNTKVTVIVQAANLTENDVSRIASIVMSDLQVSLPNILIFSVE